MAHATPVGEAGPPLDEVTALEEARRRWGADAAVEFEAGSCYDFCLVGVRVPGAAEPEWRGIGRTWELAFAEADHRAAKGA